MRSWIYYLLAQSSYKPFYSVIINCKYKFLRYVLCLLLRSKYNELLSILDRFTNLIHNVQTFRKNSLLFFSPNNLELNILVTPPYAIPIRKYPYFRIWRLQFFSWRSRQVLSSSSQNVLNIVILNQLDIGLLFWSGACCILDSNYYTKCWISPSNYLFLSLFRQVGER